MQQQLPTLDRDVRAALRSRQEPQCLFGEGPYERRDRLKALLAKAGGDSNVFGSLSNISSTAAVHPNKVGGDNNIPAVVNDELFFTEGSSLLLESRHFMAKYSIPMSYHRLRQNKERFENENSIQAETDRNEFRKDLENRLTVHMSQIGDSRPLTCCRFSPDAAMLATASFSPEVKVWANPSGELLHNLSGHTERVHTVAWHPSFRSEISKTEVGLEGCALASGDAAGRIIIWKQNDNCEFVPIHTFGDHEDRVNRVEFHPSGKFLASTSHDETWRLFSLDPFKEILLQEGHNGPVYGLAHHPDGSLIITSDLAGVVRAWDLRTGRTVMALTGHVKQVLSLDFHPYNCHIFASSSGDRTVRLWDLRKKDSFETLPCHTNLISTVQFEPKEGRFLLTASHDREARLWSTDDYKGFKVLAGHESFIMSAHIAPGSQTIATASYDRTFKLWRKKSLDDWKSD